MSARQYNIAGWIGTTGNEFSRPLPSRIAEAAIKPDSGCEVRGCGQSKGLSEIRPPAFDIWFGEFRKGKVR